MPYGNVAEGEGRRITGGEREELTSELKKRYGQGASIRELAAETGRSYGFIHRVLVESDVTLRADVVARSGAKKD